MSEGEGMLLSTSVLILCLVVLGLVKRVKSLEEDVELATVAAGNPGSLLDAKRELEKWREDRAVERSRI